jgi:hypothetical protein
MAAIPGNCKSACDRRHGLRIFGMPSAPGEPFIVPLALRSARDARDPRHALRVSSIASP